MFAGLMVFALTQQPPVADPPVRVGYGYGSPQYTAAVYNPDFGTAPDRLARSPADVTPGQLLNLLGPGISVPKHGRGSVRGHRR